MTSRSEELIVAAFRLSQSAPNFWADFIKAFEGYLDETTRKLVNAEPENLSNYQGQAQQALHIFTMLANARQTMQKAEQKRNARKPLEVDPSWLSK